MNDYFENIAVLGASGKMGSGIALVLLQKITLDTAKTKKRHSLKLIDTDEKGLYELRQYLRSHLIKFAEKNIITLRNIYKENLCLVSNQEIIEYFTTQAMDITTFTSSIEEAKSAKLIFEAIIEEEEIKSEVLHYISTICSENTFFFTNTSSIPISVLNEKAALQNRIIGFHFYNPPAVQKLLEIIAPDNINPELKSLAESIAGKLKKITVHSSDTAGFIGNGHFIREALYACKMVKSLSETTPLHQSIYLINSITSEYLIRPMGIFQLIDYIGIDVCQKIAKVMSIHLHDKSLADTLIDQMVSKGITGGQYPDGSQKAGFFTYIGKEAVGYYDFEQEKHVLFEDANWIDNQKKFLGPPPKSLLSWKSLVKDPDQEQKLKRYFYELNIDKTRGSEIARDMIKHSISIAENLVHQKIADSILDVTTVLKTGFFHLYGPDAICLKDFKTKEATKEK